MTVPTRQGSAGGRFGPSDWAPTVKVAYLVGAEAASCPCEAEHRGSAGSRRGGRWFGYHDPVQVEGPRLESDIGTPFQKHLGLRWVLLEHPEHAIRIEMEMRDDLRGPAGSLEGGVVATIADVAGASTIARAAGALVATQQLSLSLLAPGRTGPIHATGIPLRVGRSDGTSEVRVVDVGHDNRLIGVALVVIKVLQTR
jgi:uncharacterized protein (TIGR00369 family)